MAMPDDDEHYSAEHAERATRIVHVDPDPDYRLLVRIALDRDDDLAVVAEADDLATGLDVVLDAQPDVLLVEPNTGLRADVERLAALHGAAPELRTIVLTSLPIGELAWPLQIAGTLGQLSKRLRPRALADEVRQLLDVLAVVDSALDEARTDLDADLVSPRVAREFVTRTLEGWRCSDASAIIDLLVSEIVANAVIHARTTAELSVQLLPNRVRIAVTDREPMQPKRRPADPLTSTGRGIALVEKLSLAWGIERTPEGKCIWFETPRPDGGGAEPAGADRSTRR
jgi:DNA-binding NarL/FixJ family response regulator